MAVPSKSEEELRIDAKLRETSVLLQDLQQTQHERLSKRAPWHHLAHAPKPSEKETQLGMYSFFVFSSASYVNQAFFPSTDAISMMCLRQYGATPTILTQIS